MFKKTVIRRIAKRLKLSKDASEAITADELRTEGVMAGDDFIDVTATDVDAPKNLDDLEKSLDDDEPKKKRKGVIKRKPKETEEKVEDPCATYTRASLYDLCVSLGILSSFGSGSVRSYYPLFVHQVRQNTKRIGCFECDF